MNDDEVTWILVADSRQARLFEEPYQGGRVHELFDRRLRLEDADRAAGHPPTTTVHQSTRLGRHGAGERDLSQAAARRFLRRAVDQLQIGLQHGKFDRLALMAPPRSLGMIKGELSTALSSRLSATDPHDRIQASAEDVGTYLRALRKPSGEPTRTLGRCPGNDAWLNRAQAIRAGAIKLWGEGP